MKEHIQFNFSCPYIQEDIPCPPLHGPLRPSIYACGLAESHYYQNKESQWRHTSDQNQEYRCSMASWQVHTYKSRSLVHQQLCTLQVQMPGLESHGHQHHQHQGQSLAVC